MILLHCFYELGQVLFDQATFSTAAFAMVDIGPIDCIKASGGPAPGYLMTPVTGTTDVARHSVASDGDANIPVARTRSPEQREPGYVAGSPLSNGSFYR